jgi:putative ABC transport system substrate-binding protein
MRRREFMTLLGGAAAALPLAVRAQQPERVRRIGVIMGATKASVDLESGIVAFQQALRKLGWTEGRNVQFDVRWAGGELSKFRRHTAELVALAPDVILTSGTLALRSVSEATRTVPVVFVNVTDPVGAGFVDSLSRPGANVTGLMQFEYTLSGKWLELLKEIAPWVTRAAVLRDSDVTSGIGQFAVIQSVAPSVGMEVSAINLRDAGEIQRAVTTFARSPNGGLILTSADLSVVHRDLIIALAAQHKLPTVYYRRNYAALGGLISYGYDFDAHFRDAADYVDRILKGEKPADLPVRAPTKYELVINMKTAKALGLTVPQSLLARADEVIE